MTGAAGVKLTGGWTGPGRVYTGELVGVVVVVVVVGRLVEAGTGGQVAGARGQVHADLAAGRAQIHA